jgi:iron complex outermembrane recepter protein
MAGFTGLSARTVAGALLASVSALAFPAVAYAGGQQGQTDQISPGPAVPDPQAAPGADPDQEIVVTGTRIGTLGQNSPTPLTVVSSEQLLATTPRDIPDGLNKLPIFQGSQQPRRPGAGNVSEGGNNLSLRGFGPQRTLVLLDGRRVTPANANGTVDVSTIPQMLISRVDVVTGGASAVYGSDAVTGVVNFILDTKFSGLRANVNTGISTYGDAERFNVGVAGGFDVTDRLHIVASAQHRSSAAVANFDRPYGDDIYVTTGSGTVTNPFRTSANVRRADASFGGLVAFCAAPCPALGRQFVANGVLGPYDRGVTTGTANQNVGGDGAYSIYSDALVATRNDELFGRLDYELATSVNFFVQASYAEARTKGFHFPAQLRAGTSAAVSQASYFFKNNAFLPAAAQTALGNNGRFDASNLFNVGTYIVNTGPEGLHGVRTLNKNLDLKAGFTGTVSRLKWDLYYTHGENRLRVDNLNNLNQQKQFAALDAVVGPGGTIQCYAATQAATASTYADCVPLNAFGPTAITPEAFGYITATTQFRILNVLDNVGGSIAGPVFDNWAGAVEFALSGEARFNRYKVTSNAFPTDRVNCTGLRICSSTLPLWSQPVSAEVDVSNDVYEIAGELRIPLLKDVPFVQALNLNLAGRYTDYSTSGAVETWKVGLDYTISDDLRLRGTLSRDIRAPTLNDLFQPVQQLTGGFNDLHTSVSRVVLSESRGNADLEPEIARTYTVGAVLTPKAVPGLALSFDYYSIRMNNAITAIRAADLPIQNLCESSNGTSPFCALYERPLPFSDRTPSNYPTRVFNTSLNSALQRVEGFDVEANYRFRALGGSWTTRVLANHQPVNESRAFPGALLTRVTAPETRITGLLRFDSDAFGFTIQNNWLSGFSKVAQEGQIWEDPDVRAFNTLDVNIEHIVSAGNSRIALFLSVENVLNAQPDIFPASGSVGLNYPVAANQDIIGRYYTVGLRTRF